MAIRLYYKTSAISSYTTRAHGIIVKYTACLGKSIYSIACLGESKFMRYKYEGIAYLDVYQAALTRRRTPKHACLQIVYILHIYIYIYIYI